MYGQYKRLRQFDAGVLTGKPLGFGGSLIRPEATGYGLVYFTDNMLAANGKSFKDQTVLISGSGNVAQYAVQKRLNLVQKSSLFQTQMVTSLTKLVSTSTSWWTSKKNAALV